MTNEEKMNKKHSVEAISVLALKAISVVMIVFCFISYIKFAIYYSGVYKEINFSGALHVWFICNTLSLFLPIMCAILASICSICVIDRWWQSLINFCCIALQYVFIRITAHKFGLRVDEIMSVEYGLYFGFFKGLGLIMLPLTFSSLCFFVAVIYNGIQMVPSQIGLNSDNEFLETSSMSGCIFGAVSIFVSLLLFDVILKPIALKNSATWLIWLIVILQALIWLIMGIAHMVISIIGTVKSYTDY